METEALLEILGNKTRRDILKLVAEEPRYLTELREETGVQKMALTRHLDKMVKTRVLNKRSERVKKGRPRTYYNVQGTTKLTVSIAPEHFQAKVEEPRKKLRALSKFAGDLQREIKLHEGAVCRGKRPQRGPPHGKRSRKTASNR